MGFISNVAPLEQSVFHQARSHFIIFLLFKTRSDPAMTLLILFKNSLLYFLEGKIYVISNIFSPLWQTICRDAVCLPIDFLKIVLKFNREYGAIAPKWEQITCFPIYRMHRSSFSPCPSHMLDFSSHYPKTFCPADDCKTLASFSLSPKVK